MCNEYSQPHIKLKLLQTNQKNKIVDFYDSNYFIGILWDDSWDVDIL